MAYPRFEHSFPAHAKPRLTKVHAYRFKAGKARVHLLKKIESLFNFEWLSKTFAVGSYDTQAHNLAHAILADCVGEIDRRGFWRRLWDWIRRDRKPSNEDWKMLHRHHKTIAAVLAQEFSAHALSFGDMSDSVSIAGFRVIDWLDRQGVKVEDGKVWLDPNGVAFHFLNHNSIKSAWAAKRV